MPTCHIHPYTMSFDPGTICGRVRTYNWRSTHNHNTSLVDMFLGGASWNFHMLKNGILRNPKAVRTLTAFFFSDLNPQDPSMCGRTLKCRPKPWGWENTHGTLDEIQFVKVKCDTWQNFKAYIGAKWYAHGKWQRITVSQQHEDNRNNSDAKFSRAGGQFKIQLLAIHPLCGRKSCWMRKQAAVTNP